MQVEYKTGKGTILFVLPDNDAFDVRIRFKRFITWRNKVSSHIEMFDEGIIAIGFASEIDYNQLDLILDSEVFFDPDDYDLCGETYEPSSYYKDYTKKNNIFYSPIESFKSLMHHLQIHEINPLGDYPNLVNFKRLPISMVERKQGRWQEAQSRTGKWIVLFKSNT